MELKVKKLVSEAVLPAKAHRTDAGFDLVATSKDFNHEMGLLTFGTGIAIEIPPNHVGLLFPRSSVIKTGLSLANCVGVIDSSYRGEIKAVFKVIDRPMRNYEVGDKVAQLVVLELPPFDIVEATDLSNTARGSGGFGSTGK